MSLRDNVGLIFQPGLGFVLFLFSLIYFMFFVFPVLHDSLHIINFSDIWLYLVPILVMDLPSGLLILFLLSRKTPIDSLEELAISVLGISIFALLIGFAWMSINLYALDEDPTEAISYQGRDIFNYLNPLLRDECVYGVMEAPEPGFDECASLTSMALLVRYFIYLGPHNPLTLFAGSYAAWRLSGR